VVDYGKRALVNDVAHRYEKLQRAASALEEKSWLGELADEGTFDAPTREAIALAVGAVDACDYCQSAHTLGGKAAGLTTDRMIAPGAGRPTGGAKLDPLLALAREATANIGTVQDGTWKQAQEAGWTDTELTELFAHIAANLFTNYFNHYAGTELDIPQAPDAS